VGCQSTWAIHLSSAYYFLVSFPTLVRSAQAGQCQSSLFPTSCLAVCEQAFRSVRHFQWWVRWHVSHYCMYHITVCITLLHVSHYCMYHITACITLLCVSHYCMYHITAYRHSFLPSLDALGWLGSSKFGSKHLTFGFLGRVLFLLFLCFGTRVVPNFNSKRLFFITSVKLRRC
jgi:hypothetical protein